MLAQASAQSSGTPQDNSPAQSSTNSEKPAPKKNNVDAPAPAATAAGPPPALPSDPEATAWEILDKGAKDDKTSDRATAIRVLGMITNDVHAVNIAEAGLKDNKPDVRAAACVALGEMQSRSSIPKLQAALSDEDISVALAAANALQAMHDDSGYEVYYEVLTGERKASKGVIAEQMQTLKDPKQMAMIGFEEGIGFVPFAGIGWDAYRRLGKGDGSSPVRAAAAKKLATDPDPATSRALTDAAKDGKNWIVRAAALEAIAKRGNPALLPNAEMAMSDEEKGVQCTAAAAVLHLMDVQRTAKTAKADPPRPVKSRKKPK